MDRAAQSARSPAMATPRCRCRSRWRMARRGRRTRRVARRTDSSIGLCRLRRRWRRQRLRRRLRFATQPLQDTLRRERRFAEAHAGRIKNRVGDRRGTRHRCGLADAERRLVLPRQHQHVDLGHVGEFDDGVGAPFACRHRGAVERDFLHQRAAGGLDDVAVDLVPHAVRIDHQAGILSGDHARHADIAGRLVDGDVGDPGRPRRAVAGKLAVHVERIGKAAPAHDVAFGHRLLPHRPWLPAGAFGHGVDEVDRARGPSNNSAGIRSDEPARCDS